MPNTIQLKTKLSAGAPALVDLAVGEVCLNIPEESIYWKKDASTIIGPIGVGAAAVWGAIGGTLSNQTDLQNALNAKADLNAPSLTGIPTAPTAAGGTNTTQLATTAFVQAAIAALVNAAPGALDDLNELAAAIGDDPNFAATIATQLGQKLDSNSVIDGGTLP